MQNGRLNRVDVETPVLGEFLVFAGNDRDFQIVGDFVQRFPVALQVDRLAVEPGFYLAFDHQRRARWRHPAQNQNHENTACGEPQQGFDDATKNRLQHRDGLAEPVERAIIQTVRLSTIFPWSP